MATHDLSETVFLHKSTHHKLHEHRAISTPEKTLSASNKQIKNM